MEKRRLSLPLYFLVFTLISFHQTGPLLANADSFAYNNSKVCLGSNSGLSHTHSGQPWNRYLSYVNMYASCTTLLENLEIVFLDGNYSYDMSFLESIREVNGYVLIDGNYFEYLPLKNLRLIRGRTLYKPQGSTVSYSLYISTNRKTNSTSVGLKELHLTSLHEILDGNVLIENNNLLCHELTIDWTDIRKDASKVQLKPPPQEQYRRPCEECHPSCTFNGVAHCWGPGPDKCQKITSGACNSNCEWGCFGRGPNQCCDQQCAGGCGHNKSDCWACRHFVNYGVCMDKCPGEMIYNMKTYKYEENPDVRYTYGANCLKECPDHMLIEKDACVARCSQGHMSNEDRKCKPCTNGICPKSCPTAKVDGTNVANFSGCTIIDGYLQILANTFTGQYSIANVSDLDVFESVVEITGYLLVQGSHPDFNTLSFLRNLRVVRGRTRYQTGKSELAVAISSTSLVELGLTSLKEISSGSVAIQMNQRLERLGLVSLERIGDGNIGIQNNPNLCYVNSINWTQISANRTRKTVVEINANQINFCEPNGSVCSSECSSDGCWGPTDEDCRFCAGYRYGRTCVDSCRFQKGLYPEEVNGTKQCQHCHEECLDSCSGKEANNCEECRNVRDGPYCRAKCPESKYANASGTCEPCYKDCKDGCTGPGNHLGFEGCNACHLFLELKETKPICIPENSECPDGFYTFQGRFDIETQNGTGKVRANGCRPCHKECRTCDGSGTETPSCECKHFVDGDQCVPKCPFRHYNDSSGRCLKCHKDCDECYGPTAFDCTFCLNVRIYEDGKGNRSYNTSFRNESIHEKRTVAKHEQMDSDTLNNTNVPHGEFKCADKCPDDLSEKKRFDVSGRLQDVCQPKPTPPDNSEQEPLKQNIGLHIGLPVVVGVIVIGLVAVIVVFLRRQMARSEEYKLRITAKMNGLDVEEIVDPTDTKPDLSTLRLIMESELRRGSEIGSGAFGTVYKGIWIPAGEDVKIPVAIKVLTEATNSSLNVELLEEARIMASVTHPCCIRILAVCMTAQMMLITQLMPHGSLLDYLRKNKNNIGSSALLRWSAQIAKGMHYLEERGIVHRDLAARNVLVQGPAQVRITDFGLAKLLSHNEEQYQATGGKMPIKWLALESMQHRIFTHKSDVWAYGVTLWELFTYGQRPYESIRAVEMAHRLEMGERLSQPPICTIDIYMIMIKCWMVDADSRPTFLELENEFANMTKDPGRYVVIPGDRFMRLPSVVEDMTAAEWLRSVSLPDEGPEKLVTADEYLRPQDLLGGFHSPESRYIVQMSSIKEEENNYENSCQRASSVDTNSTCSPASKFLHLEEAAAARNLKSLHKEEQNLKYGNRYASDPCREEETGAKGTTSVATEADKKELQSDEMELKCMLTDEADYLQPKSSRDANCLDVVEDSNSSKEQPSNSLGIGNPEYYLLPDDDRPSLGSAERPRSNDVYMGMGQMNEPPINNNNYFIMETKPQNSNKPSPFDKEASYSNL